MRAGKLNQFAIHYKLTNGQSPSGALTARLTQLRTVKVGFDERRADEAGSSDVGDRIQAVNEYKLIARHHSIHRYRVGDYLKINGDLLKVTAVDDLNKRQPVQILVAFNPTERPPEVAP